MARPWGSARSAPSLLLQPHASGWAQCRASLHLPPVSVAHAQPMLLTRACIVRVLGYLDQQTTGDHTVCVGDATAIQQEHKGRVGVGFVGR